MAIPNAKEINIFSRTRRTVSAWLYGTVVWTSIQAFLDWLTIFFGFLASYFFYTGALDRVSPQTFEQFLVLSAGAGVLYVLILQNNNLYRRESSLLNIRELRGIFTACIYAAAIIFAVVFYLRTVFFSRLTITWAIVSAPILLYLQRQLFYRVYLMLHQNGWWQRRVFVYGAGDIGVQLAKRMCESPFLGFFPVGFLDDDPRRHRSSVQWVGIGPRKGISILGGEEVIRDARRYGADLVLIALPTGEFERNRKLVETCVAEGLDYAIVPNAYEDFIQQAELYELGGIPLLRRKRYQASLYFLASKRVVDFTCATVAMILLSPLYFLIGAAIKINSPGPVVFKQKRVGLRGRHMSIYKFRSMYIEAPKYAETPVESSDPRITPVGRFLRRTSLDELPQLFNVFRGDMSLVGPRPEMAFIVDQYTPLERMRLEAKPGITGLWQISVARGEPIHKNMEYDLYYLENRSMLLDFAIMIKTILSVIRGVGAI